MTTRTNNAAIDWPQAVVALDPYVVKLATPRGTGTGFALSMSPGLVVIATAAHVVDNAHYWEEPIRVLHPHSGKSVLLRANERAIFLKEELDTAAVLIPNGALPLPESMLELPPPDKHLKVGFEVGWLGFPAVAPNQLCFFTGRISSWVENPNSYLVDGVAINGVSGGPAFFLKGGTGVLVTGVVSAYIPNRATGEALPGLCVVRDVRQFVELAQQYADMAKAQQQQSAPTEPPPPPEKPDGAA